MCALPFIKDLHAFSFKNVINFIKNGLRRPFDTYIIFAYSKNCK